MGVSWVQWMWSGKPGARAMWWEGIPGISPVWTRLAVRLMRVVWRRKVRMRVPLRRRPRYRPRRAKKNDPKAKQTIEVSERTQPYGLALWFDAPRPTKMVFPSPGVSDADFVFDIAGSQAYRSAWRRKCCRLRCGQP